MMSDSAFTELAEATLDAIEAAVERAHDSGAADIEIERSGNVLTLELADKARIVINSQAPMQQIWVAARSGGFHYARKGDQWRDTRDDSELFATLSRLLSEHSGAPLVLAP